MNYNIIENGECTIGKFKDITKYLSNQLIEINIKYKEDSIELDEMLEESFEIINIMNYMQKNNFNENQLVKLYRDEFNELCYEEINI